MTRLTRRVVTTIMVERLSNEATKDPLRKLMRRCLKVFDVEHDGTEVWRQHQLVHLGQLLDECKQFMHVKPFAAAYSQLADMKAAPSFRPDGVAAILRQQAQPVLLRGTAHPHAQTSVRAGEPFAQSEGATGAAQQELIGWQLKKPARHPGRTSWLPSIYMTAKGMSVD